MAGVMSALCPAVGCMGLPSGGWVGCSTSVPGPGWGDWLRGRDCSGLPLYGTVWADTMRAAAIVAAGLAGTEEKALVPVVGMVCGGLWLGAVLEVMACGAR